MRVKGTEVRTNLKVLESLTFNCTKAKDLDDLNKELEAVITCFKKTLPSSKGLIVRPALKQRAKKLRQSALQRYGKIPAYQKRGRKRTAGTWRYLKRVGRKAQTYRKVLQLFYYLFHLCNYFYNSSVLINLRITRDFPQCMTLHKKKSLRQVNCFMWF